MPGRSVHCRIVTPQGPALDIEARSIMLPAHDGLIGVLPGHAPLLTQLIPGVVRYTDQDNHRGFMFVSGGFAQIAQDELLILAEEALTREQTAVSYPQQQLLDARAMPARTAAQVEARDRAMQRARQLVALTEMH
jgi:F-type H+-transporting ATPase subunit epsilon